MQKLARAVSGTTNGNAQLLPGARERKVFRTVGYGGDSGSIRDMRTLFLGSYHNWQQHAEITPSGDSRKNAPTNSRAKAHSFDLREQNGEACDLFRTPNQD